MICEVWVKVLRGLSLILKAYWSPDFTSNTWEKHPENFPQLLLKTKPKATGSLLGMWWGNGFCTWIAFCQIVSYCCCSLAFVWFTLWGSDLLYAYRICRSRWAPSLQQHTYWQQQWAFGFNADPLKREESDHCINVIDFLGPDFHLNGCWFRCVSI